MISNNVLTRPSRRTVFYGLLFIVSALLAVLGLMAPMLASAWSASLEVGQVAPQDYRAPSAITYVSDVLTEERREAAMRSVPPIYTAPDTGIARQQLEQLRNALAYISSVRADPYASTQQKLDDLAALDDVHLNQEMAISLLALNESRWQVVQQEAIVALEQVMRSAIRPDRVEEARSSVPAQVSLSLPEQQAAIAAELAAAFVTANSLYSETLTEQARQSAREAVQPVSRTFMAGQTIVQRGQILNPEDIEALQKMDLIQREMRWQDFASASALVLLFFIFIALYLQRKFTELLEPRKIALIALLFLLFLQIARSAIPGQAIMPYAFPVAAYSLVIASLFGAEFAIVSTLPLAVMIAYGLPNAMELTVYYALSSLLGVLALGKARRLTSFFQAGAMVAASGFLIILAYQLPQPGVDWMAALTLALAALLNGLAAGSIAVLTQFFLAQILGMTTPMQLMELTRPENPLLQLLLREAPGTYQHSLQVSNLAEQAAERLGADTLLTRVGALYHDVGKTVNPVFFIENQVPGYLNPHDDLDPEISAGIIIRHVADGLELGRKYRLPRRILDFIAEHHGTMLTRYQYIKAVQAAGDDESQVDADKFRYPGPRPKSRETAILMLADGCEARVRAEKPKDEDELRSLIKSTVDSRVAMGELDDTDLTLQDLAMIVDSFTATLRGIYHPRVKYPALEKRSTEGVGPSEVTVPINGTARATRPVEADFSRTIDSPSPTPE